MTISTHKIGIALAIAAGTCFGLAVPIGAAVFQNGADVPAYMLFTRGLMAAGLIALCAMRGQSILPRRNFLPILLCAAAINVIFSIAHFTAIQIMPVALVTMVIFLYPLMLSGLSAALDGIRPTPLFLLSAVIALIGLYLVLGPAWGAFNWIGGGLALLAAALIAIHIYINGRVLQTHDPEIFGAQLIAATAIMFAALTPVTGLHMPQNAAGWGLMILAALIVLVGQLVFFRAIAAIGPVQTGLFIKIEPVVTLIAAGLLLGEKLFWPQIIGAGLVIAALVINSFDRPIPKMASIPE